MPPTDRNRLELVPLVSDSHMPHVKLLESVEYQCIMDVFTLSSFSAQGRAICVNRIKGSCPK